MIHNLIQFSIAAIIVAAVFGYIGYLATKAWQDTRESPKTEFFTCDKHGAFPMTWTMEVPLPEGDYHRVCPFCFDEAYKKAELFVQSHLSPKDVTKR